ncbi:MAG: 1-acyl-sn-glycerol-3-phosphate acyltransferase [Rhizobiaceae bacterium]|nr:1-acyl-sn-glycerol-3-phosphate acyltransferase [Rhizobiaceae bacterium]
MLVLFGVLTPFFALGQIVVLATGIGNRRTLPRLWHGFIVWMLDFRVHITGKMSTERPLFLAGNHVSWTDIMVIGSVAEVNFIAKQEVKKWAVIGPLSRLQNTVFVDRDRRRKSAEQASEISVRLKAGDPMFLFAEGSTGDGNLLIPFKSTLFGAASLAVDEGATERVMIQPVSIAYTRLHGMPTNRLHRPLVSWIGDRVLMPHIVQLLKEGAVDVELKFGEPVEYRKGVNRKEVAREVERRVQAMFYESLREPAKSRKPR